MKAVAARRGVVRQLQELGLSERQALRLLDEAPLPLIVAGVAEVAERTHTPHKTLWKHLAGWAQALQSPRAAWA